MKEKLMGILGDYVVMTLAVFLYVFSWEAFMIPNGMSSGGLTGLCTILQFATGGAIDVSASYLVANVFLLIIGFMVLGKAFGFRTIYCIALSTLLFKVVGSLDALKAVEGNFLFINERFLIPVIAGFMEGLALGIIFRVGGSTGGTDIVALFFNKFWPVSPGKVFLVMDFIIITAILTLPGKSFSDMIYGYLMMIASTAMVDFIIIGQKSSVQIMVFSDKFDQIADYIINKMERGVTVLRAQGWYTKLEKDVLLIVLNRKELHEVTRMIKEIDPKAFVSVSQTSSVYGEGFDEIKTGLDVKKKIRNSNVGS